MNICCYCESKEEKKIYQIREMMYGTREQYEYWECANCGGLQIKTIPGDMSKYYPSDYYSYIYSRDNFLKRAIKRLRFQYTVNKKGFIGKILFHQFGETPFAQWLMQTNTQFSDPVLDVGCGNGSFLIQMHDVGFTNLTGIDPHIKNDMELDSGLRILKKEIHEIEGNFKLIMFHHSLEHVESPHDHILAASKLLNPGQYILIRIPVIGGFVWREYSTNWIQLDAPRHLSIPSCKSMEILAQRTGFTLERIIYDSSGFQFWGSEQYKRDIPFYDKHSYSTDPHKSIFTQTDIDNYDSLTARLNIEQDGDQACFYFRKS